MARRLSTPLVGLLLALLTWREVNFTPVDSLDPSWQAALHMAAHFGLPFEGLVFTYGPLGFLAQPVAHYPTTILLSSFYVFGVGLAACAALVSVLRRSIGLPAAGVATFLLVAAARDLGVIDVVVVAVVVAAFGLLRGDHAARTEEILVVAGGVVAGIHLLVKFNTGVTVLVVGAATAWVVGRRPWRSGAMYLGAALASLVAGWLLTANSIADLVPFFGRSMQVASGYSEAMAIEAEGRGIFYPVAGVVAAIVAALGWWASRGWVTSRRVAMGMAGVLWLFAAFKLGFVRHDRHDIAYFAEAMLVGAVLASAVFASTELASTELASTVLAGSVAVSLAGLRKAVPAVAFVGLVVAYAMATGPDAAAIVNPGPEVARAAEDIFVLATEASRERAIARGRANLRSRYYHLPPLILNALRGHTVHIRPWEAGIAWAYPEIRWRPVPVFQEYTAYTAELDELNASFLRGPRAPERILAEEKTVDIRNPDWESPATVVAILCHYRQLVADDHWQVLERVPDRCGPARTLAVVRAEVGDTVPIPDMSGREALLVARVTGLDHSLLYRLRSTLWRTPETYVILQGRRRSRLVPGTAPNGLIVRTPDDKLGFSQPFATESAHYLRVEQDTGVGLSSRLTIEFAIIPVLN